MYEPSKTLIVFELTSMTSLLSFYFAGSESSNMRILKQSHCLKEDPSIAGSLGNDASKWETRVANLSQRNEIEVQAVQCNSSKEKGTIIKSK